MNQKRIEFILNDVKYHNGNHCNDCAFVGKSTCDLPKTITYEIKNMCLNNPGMVWVKDTGNKHAEMMMEYAKDSINNSAAYKDWECKDEHCAVWQPLNDHPRWLPYMEYRRKVKQNVVKFGNHQVKRPHTKQLKPGQFYWTVMQTKPLWKEWKNDEIDNLMLQNGLVQLDHADAITHYQSLINYNKMCCGL